MEELNKLEINAEVLDKKLECLGKIVALRGEAIELKSEFKKRAVVPFEDVEWKDKFQEIKQAGQIDIELYSDIEKLIIHWNNDGTKTAGCLTRRIFQLLNDKGI